VSDDRRLTALQARRIALAAQGFGQPRPDGAISRRHVRRVFGRVGVVQIDSVNVLVRSQYLPLYSRIGAYPAKLLDDAAYGKRRELFEYWGHEASLLPFAAFPLLRWRMARAERLVGMYSSFARFAREKSRLIKTVLREVERRGPLSAGDLGMGSGTGSWWGWSDAKAALECLFWAGRVTTARRRGFERVYDLTERVIPPALFQAPAPAEHDAQRELLRIALRAHGVATERDLRDYFRLGPADAKPRIAELVEAGEFVPVRVEGWKNHAYVAPDVRVPRRIAASALLSPFDSLVWERDRTSRLFGFHYRLEIYTPAHKRVHGYYVLPFLFGERLVARVDLKADRAAGTLRAIRLHVESGAGRPDVEAALQPELARMAEWLGLRDVDGPP
jgi:uncharacterized protein YcaQ